MAILRPLKRLELANKSCAAFAPASAAQTAATGIVRVSKQNIQHCTNRTGMKLHHRFKPKP